MAKTSIPEPGTRLGDGVVTRVADLAPGDMITELDTPKGPWYEVVQCDERTLTLDARLDNDEPELLVSIEYSATAAVLRRSR